MKKGEASRVGTHFDRTLYKQARKLQATLVRNYRLLTDGGEV